MLALTPVTVKSTKSMLAMQRLQPEMKKLQAKYKGAENRELLNQEMMKLYKENGTSPFGACLPSLLQMPFLIVLYSLIRGLSYMVPEGSDIYERRRSDSQVHAKARMRLAALHPNELRRCTKHWWPVMAKCTGGSGWICHPFRFSHHAFPGSASQAVLVLPYLVLIGAAMFLQYYQMKQMNSRNPQAAAANPQMQQMQKFFPIIFGVIYLRVPAGATIYMVVSSAMRIGTQEFMFRSGMVTPVVHEREIGATKEKEKEKPPPKAVKKTSTRHGRDGGGQGDAAAGEERGEDQRRKDERPGAHQREEAGRGEADDERQGGERRRRRGRTGTEVPPAVALEADKKGSIASGVG